MHPRHGKLESLAILGIATLVMLGCAGQSGFNDEMRQQEVEMTSEVTQWTDQLAQWEAQHAEMRAWHSSHPVPSSGSASAEAMAQHQEKLAQHEQEVTQLKTDLDSHKAKLSEEAAKPEKDRVAAHAALWAEHMRIKTSFGMLSGAHEALGKEHGELTSQTPPTPPPGS